MKDLWCAVGSPSSLGVGCSSIVPLTSRGTCCHSTPTQSNPHRTGGGGPLLSTSFWLMVPKNNSIFSEHCEHFLSARHLAPALPRRFSSSMNRVDLVKELWEYLTVAERRCWRGQCESWHVLETSVLTQEMMMKRSLDYFWRSAEMGTVYNLNWECGLYFYNAIYSGCLI